MYNGIGLATARGTGTNGYVTKNLSFVRVTKEKVEYKPDEEIKKLESYINRKGNADLLKHDRKRKVELKCLEMEELMAEEGYSQEEIEKKVSKFRKVLLDKEAKDENQVDIELDENGRPNASETHKIAEATDLKNRKLREAFGIGEFDSSVKAKQEEEERRMRIEKAKELKTRKYHWVDDDDLKDESDIKRADERRTVQKQDKPLRRDEEPKEIKEDRAKMSKKKKESSSERSSSGSDSDSEAEERKKKAKGEAKKVELVSDYGSRRKMPEEREKNKKRANDSDDKYEAKKRREDEEPAKRPREVDEMPSKTREKVDSVKTIDRNEKRRDNERTEETRRAKSRSRSTSRNRRRSNERSKASEARREVNDRYERRDRNDRYREEREPRPRDEYEK